MQETISFSVDVTGEDTKRHFTGLFSAKTSLSFRERLQEDEQRRLLLGSNPESAGTYAESVAKLLSFVNVRLVDAPNWWKESKGGVDLKDENVLKAVYETLIDGLAKQFGEQTKKAEEAQKELKKIADSE